jgi:hypothetical protein
MPRKGKRGPLPIKLDKAEIQRWASTGATQAEIANKLGVSVATIERRLAEPEYREALLMGRGDLAMSLRAAQIRKGLAGDTNMLKWLGEQYLGQAHAHRFVDKEGKDRGLDIESVRAYMKQAPHDGEPRDTVH